MIEDLSQKWTIVLYFRLVCLTVCLTSFGSAAAPCYSEDPCDRVYQYATGFSDSEQECRLSCLSTGYEYAALYQNEYCFCSDVDPDTLKAYEYTCPPATAMEDNLPCGSQNSSAYLYHLGRSFPREYTITDVTMDEASQFVTLTSNISEVFSIVIADHFALPVLPTFQFPPPSSMSTEITLPVPTFQAVELTVIAMTYEQTGAANELVEDLQDCDVDYRCLKKTVVIPERKLPYKSLEISCPEAPRRQITVGVKFECDIIAYGSDISVNIDFGDGQVTSQRSTILPDSEEEVLGRQDSIDLPGVPVSDFYIIRDIIFTTEAAVYAIEVIKHSGFGSISFYTTSLSCEDGQIAQPYSSRCIEDTNEAYFFDVSIGSCSLVSPADTYIWDATRRLCVNKLDEADTVELYTLPLAPVDTFTLIHTENMTDADDNVTTVIYLPSYIKVFPGSYILIEIEPTLALVGETVPSYSSQTVTVSGGSISFSPGTSKPHLAVYTLKPVVYKVLHTYLEECVNSTVSVLLSSFAGTDAKQVVLRPQKLVTGVQIQSEHMYAMTNREKEFQIPFHDGQCDALYMWEWQDGFPLAENTTSPVINHTFITAGTYVILVTAINNLNNMSAQMTVQVDDEILGLQVAIDIATVFGVPTPLDVTIQQGTHVVVDVLTDDTTDYNWLLADQSSISHTYSSIGVYDIVVNVSNPVSWMVEYITHPVEIIITGLNVTSDPCIVGEDCAVTLSITAGSRVNFTCDFNNTGGCQDFQADWQQLPGTITLHPDEYKIHGNYDVEVTAINLVTPLKTFTTKVRIYHPILNASVELSQPLLLHPGDPIDFTVYMLEGSQMLFIFKCTDLHLDLDEIYEMFNTTTVFSHTFSKDGVFMCTMDIDNPVSSFSESWLFTVQYAIQEDMLMFGLYEASDVVEYTVLRPPLFSKDIEFILFKLPSAPLPTNVSWSIDFGNNETRQSSSYILTSDKDTLKSKLLYQQMYSFLLPIFEAGDHTAVLNISNLLSEATFNFTYRVYEEIYGLQFIDIVHKNGEKTWPAFPNIYNGKQGDPGVIFDHFQIEFDLQMSSMYTRGSHSSWSWTFGDGETEYGDLANGTEVIHSYLNNSLPGDFTVHLTVANDVSTQTTQRTITLMKSVNDIDLWYNVTSTPWNTTTFWIIDFGAVGTDACYLLDLGDPEAEPVRYYSFGDVEFCKKHVYPSVFASYEVQEFSRTMDELENEKQMEGVVSLPLDSKFFTLGRYRIKFIGTNLVSQKVEQVIFGVTMFPCEFPVVDMLENYCYTDDCSDDDVKDVWRSRSLEIYAVVILDCPGRTASFNWTVSKVVGDGEGLEELELDPELLEGKNRLLVFPERFFEYGRYRFELNVSMDGELGIFTYNYTDIDIVKSPLNLSFGFDRDVAHAKFGKAFILDALTYTTDPDRTEEEQDLLKSEYKFTWICARWCETSPIYNTDDWSIVEPGKLCEPGNITEAEYFIPFIIDTETETVISTGLDLGCFFDDGINSTGLFGFSPDGSGVISLNTSSSYESQNITITVFVKKDTRIASRDLTLVLSLGDPPIIELQCVVNCIEKTNTNNKFSYSSIITNRISYYTYIFEWSLMNITGTVNNYRQGKFIPRSLWVPLLANTKITDPSIAFRANTMVPSLYLKDILLIARSWRDTSPNNYGIQYGRVSFNTPPQIYGKCAVKPAVGISGVTTFELKCTEGIFQDGDMPMAYKLSYRANKKDSYTYIKGPYSHIRYMSDFKLPAGRLQHNSTVYVGLHAIDRYGAESMVEMTAQVKLPFSDITKLVYAYGELVHDIDDSIIVGDLDVVASVAGTIMTFLNSEDSDMERYINNLMASNGTNTTAINATYEIAAARLAKMEVRKKSILAISKMELNTLKAVVVASKVVESSTAIPNEIDMEILSIGSDILSKGMEFIENSPDMEYSVKKQTMTSLSASAGNVIGAGASLKVAKLRATSATKTKSSEETSTASTSSDNEVDEMNKLLAKQVELIDKLGMALVKLVVKGETTEELLSSSLNMGAQKDYITDFNGQMRIMGEKTISASIPGLQDVLPPVNNTAAMVQNVMSFIENPFIGNTTDHENITASKTIHITMTDDDGEELVPVSNTIEAPIELMIPNEKFTQLTPTVDQTGPTGKLSKIRKISVLPGMALSLTVRVFINTNASSNSSIPADENEYNRTTTTENEPTSTTASQTTTTYILSSEDDSTNSTGNDTIKAERFAARTYIKVGAAPSIESYDFLCDTEQYSIFIAANRSTEEGARVGDGPADPYKCFISDKLLNIKEETFVFYGVEYYIYEYNVTSNGTEIEERVKRAAADSDSTTTTALPFTTETLISDEDIFYEVTSFTTVCRYWNPFLSEWISEGCEVGPLTTGEIIQCLCNIISVTPPSGFEEALVRNARALDLFTTTAAPDLNRKPYSPLAGLNFAAAFSEPFNTFDPAGDWSNLAENPLIFSVMVSLMCFYLCVLIWARRWDIRDTAKAGAAPLLDNHPQDTYLYELTIFTGSKRNSGTTAKVSMIFSGFEEETPPRLIYDSKRPVLQTGGIDSFLMAVPRPLGPLNHVRVWHDNSGKSPGWFFGYMCVIDLITREKFFFVCNNWLSISEGDGIIDRVIPTATREDLVDFSHLFWSKVRKDLTDSHIWFSVFGRPPKSVFTRVQRVTCCLVLLFTTMMANTLLYKEDSPNSPSQSFKIGPISLTQTEIFNGIIASLIIFPFNLLIVQIFRTCKRRESSQLKKAKKTLDEQMSSKTRNKTYAAEMERRRKLKKTKLSEFLFPWWFKFVAYFLCLAGVAVSFWVTVSIGLQSFGAEKSERWMISFVISFFESLLLSQPIKVVLFAMFYAMVIRSPTIDDELDNDPGLIQGEEYLHVQTRTIDTDEYIQQQRSLAKYKVLPTPPDPQIIEAARHRRIKEREMQGVLREILTYVVFLYLIYTVSYGSKDIAGTYYYNHLRNQLEKGLETMYGPMTEGPKYNYTAPVDMRTVSSIDGFWDWMFQTYIPVVYSKADYSGEQLPRGSTVDGVNFLVGTTRIRQIRVKKVPCPVSLRYIDKYCGKSYSRDLEDTESYSFGWKDGEPQPGFVYNTSEELDTLTVYGHRQKVSYGGGGYSYNLDRRQQSASEKLTYLMENNWVDEYTRAVFIEFTLYNNQVNLYAVSYTHFEFLPTGAMYGNFRMKLMKLERYSGSYALMVLVSEIGLMLFTIYFFVKEAIEIKKKKSQYFKEFWSWAEFLVLILLLIVLALTSYRFYLLTETSKKRRSTPKLDFIGFHFAANFEEYYIWAVSLCGFAATVKFLKILRFNKNMNILGHTMLLIMKPFLSFISVMFGVFVAYCHMTYLIYNSLLPEFNSFGHTMGTLFTLMLNKFDYKSMETANPIFAPIIFFTFVVIMGFTLVNFMISIIMDGFTVMREELAGKPNKYEIVDFLVSQFKNALGFQSSKGPGNTENTNDFIEDVDVSKELDLKMTLFHDRAFHSLAEDPDFQHSLKMAELQLAKKQAEKKKLIIFS